MHVAAIRSGVLARPGGAIRWLCGGNGGGLRLIAAVAADRLARVDRALDARQRLSGQRPREHPEPIDMRSSVLTRTLECGETRRGDRLRDYDVDHVVEAFHCLEILIRSDP